MTPFTLLDDGRPVEVAAQVEGRTVSVPAAEVERALGWAVSPEGLCAQGLCLPVPPGVRLETAGGLDLAALATVLDRPLALDLEERAAWLGASAGDRARRLRSLQAPEFTLPDLAGRPHALAEHRGRKVLLVAWASW